MKKILLAIAGVCLAATSFAQSHFSAGYQNTSTKDGDDRIPFNGIYAGGGYDFAIGKTGLVLTPGIYYSYGLYSKKESVTDSSKPVDVITTSKTKWKEHAIDIPVRVGYGYDITPNARIFAFAGPVFNIGLYSKSNSVVTVDGLKTRDITYDYYDKDSGKRQPQALRREARLWRRCRPLPQLPH